MSSITRLSFAFAIVLVVASCSTEHIPLLKTHVQDRGYFFIQRKNQADLAFTFPFGSF